MLASTCAASLFSADMQARCALTRVLEGVVDSDGLSIGGCRASALTRSSPRDVVAVICLSLVLEQAGLFAEAPRGTDCFFAAAPCSVFSWLSSVLRLLILTKCRRGAYSCI